MRSWIIAAAICGTTLGVAPVGERAHAQNAADVVAQRNASVEQLKILGGGDASRADPSRPQVRDVCGRINVLETRMAQHARDTGGSYIVPLDSAVCRQPGMPQDPTKG